MTNFWQLPHNRSVILAIGFFALSSFHAFGSQEGSQEPRPNPGREAAPQSPNPAQRTPAATAAESTPIYSGPIAGEAVPELKVWALQNESEELIQLIPPTNSEVPALVIFVHERTRPGFAVLRGVAKFAEQLNQQLDASIVFLTNDVMETRQWANAAKAALPAGVRLTVSPDGQEGPGAWGLNRNVTLTVVISKSGQVLNNFAIVQPSANSDLANITQAMATAAGVAVPTAETIATWIGQPAMNRNAENNEVNIRPLLAPVIQLKATAESVAAAAEKVEARAAMDEPFRIAVGAACRRIFEAGKLEEYGTTEAQRHLKFWADTFK